MATDQNLIDALDAVITKANATATSSTPEELVYLGKALEAVGPASTTRFIVEIGESERARIISVGDAKIAELSSGLKTINGEAIQGSGDIDTSGGVIAVYHNFDKTERVRNHGTTPIYWEGSRVVVYPKSANSKFFFMFEPFWEMGSPQHFRLRLFRNGVHSNTLDNTGSANYGTGFSNLSYDPDNNSTAHNQVVTVWDEPNTTASITYEIRGVNHSGTQNVAMNRFTGNYGSGTTKITVFEYE